MRVAKLKTAVRFSLPSFFAVVTAAWGQYGIVNLPSWLADAGVQVQKTTTSTQRFNLWCEGPVVAQNGDLFFSEQNAGVIWKVTPAGTLTSLIDIGSYSNGLDFNPVTGRLVVCERARITERDTVTGSVLKVITSDGAGAWTGGGSGGSNDLSFAANGDLFFTSWNYHIYFHSNDSSVNQDWNFPSSYGTCQWNGIEYIEEKNLVYLCQYGRNRVVAFNVNPATHLIDTSTLRQFGPTIYSPDGITVDSNYNVYVCNNSTLGSYPNSVVVLDSSGTVLGSIRMTQSASSAAVNCVFGNSMSGGAPNPHTLYITGDSGAFKVQLKVAGRVRPGATAARRDRDAYSHVNDADVRAPGFSVVRSETGFRIKSGSGSAAFFSVFTPSGRCCGKFSVTSSSSFTWRPAARGVFIIFMSSEHIVETGTVMWGY